MPRLPRLDDGRVCYDISPEITPELAVFPGDTPFSREVTVDFADPETGGANYLASAIHSTVHLGAHVDAPNHYSRPESGNAGGIETRSLDYYLGSCQIVAVKIPRGRRIKPEDIHHAPIRAKRVIFKTGSFPDPNRWNGDFNSLSPELIRALSSQGVILVGIDTPSVDPAEDKVLEAHQAIREKDMAILEGVVLEGVPEGLYTLVALPLRIRDADASPVRAILVRESIREERA